MRSIEQERTVLPANGRKLTRMKTYARRISFLVLWLAVFIGGVSLTVVHGQTAPAVGSLVI